MSDYGWRFLLDIAAELDEATAKWPPINSAHEGYAVILEEIEEYWEEVRKKQTEYDLQAQYDELVQIAAMATRTAVDVVMPQLAVKGNDAYHQALDRLAENRDKRQGVINLTPEEAARSTATAMRLAGADVNSHGEQTTEDASECEVPGAHPDA